MLINEMDENDHEYEDGEGPETVFQLSEDWNDSVAQIASRNI